MNLEVLPPHFKIVDTKDGSPSVEIRYPEASEQMHSSQGAFEESLYIYQYALEKAHDLQFPLQILSVGLGLGYNEIISAGYALKNKVPLKINTYENEKFLVDSFKAWCQNDLDASSALFNVYETIFKKTADYFYLSDLDLRSNISELSSTQNFCHLGPLSTHGPFFENHTLIYFDPFSSKASPDFWTSEFIEMFLKSSSSNDCILSTYAATGNLKRALKHQKFSIDLRPGFAGKRNSIFAIRQSSRF